MQLIKKSSFFLVGVLKKDLRKQFTPPMFEHAEINKIHNRHNTEVLSEDHWLLSPFSQNTLALNKALASLSA